MKEKIEQVIKKLENDYEFALEYNNQPEADALDYVIMLLRQVIESETSNPNNPNGHD